jgi:GH15 family glucan-1,4-alpha-glucosidase
MFKRLVELRNDVGLLAEECEPRARRQSFPQACSHAALINAACRTSAARGRRNGVPSRKTR